MPLDNARDRVPSVSMPSVSVGEKRKQAGWRAVYGIAYWLVIIFVGPILAAIYLLWMFVDILYQALTNNEGLAAGGYGTELFERQNKLREYITFGEGSRDSWRR